MGFFVRPFFRRRRRMERIPPVLLRMLAEANRLAEAGDHLGAAKIFDRLAQGAQERDHPRYAANLYARTAHAYVAGGDQSAALAAARTALHGFIQLQMPERLFPFYGNLTHKMREAGMEEAAAALEQEFGGEVERLSVSAPMPSKAEEAFRGRLPARCSQCGAPLRSDEVEWIDAQRAACLYCGSVVQTERP